MTRDRGVSEVLGYVLVISIVMVMVAVVMTTGIGGLESSQQAEQVNNMERGFDVLSHNIGQLTTGDAPSRATELRLVDGTLAFEERTTITVKQNDQPIGNVSIEPYPIAYESDAGTKIVYEAGAIIRTDNNRSTMLQAPPFVFSNDGIVIHGVLTRPAADSADSADGDGTILVRADYIDATTATTIADDDVELHINSSRIDAWEGYFEDIDGTTIEQSSQQTLVVAIDGSERSVSIVQSHIRIDLKG